MSEIVSIFADAESLAAATADRIVNIIADAVGQRGHASLALSGGRTPQLFFPLLASEPRRSAIAWDHISFFWADERCVQRDHPDSNFGLADQLLLSRVPILAPQIHRIHGELAPESAAERYVQEMTDYFSGLPRFDMILLGIGNDGHTASLFPDTTALDAPDYACAVHVKHLNSWRVTLTLPVLKNARHLIFSVSGEDKSDMMEKLLNTESQMNYPAGRVSPTDGELIWLIDNAAASLLPLFAVELKKAF